MRFSAASVVRLERSFGHSLKSLLLAKIVRLNAPLGYVKKALIFSGRLHGDGSLRTSFRVRCGFRSSIHQAIFNAFNVVLFY